MSNYPIYEFLGVKITSLGLDELLDEILDALSKARKLQLGNVNIHAMNLSQSTPAFRDALNKMDIVFCDGYGVKIGASMLGINLKQRFTPPDFIDSVMKQVIETKGSVFLLGARKGVAEKAGKVLQERNPGLIIAGHYHGYFDKRHESSDNKIVVDMINQSGASLLLVGFGMPTQEQWLIENREVLNPSVSLTIGALFDTLSGNIQRMPRFITDHGLEWLGRLIIEPRRLWKRYLLGIPLFFWTVFNEKISKKHIKLN